MQDNKLLSPTIFKLVQSELACDIGDGDITAELLPPQQTVTAQIITNETAIICGVEWVTQAFQQVDSSLVLTWQVEDGDTVEPGQRLLSIRGNARSIVTAERTALNGLQTFSGVATVTQQYVKQLAGTKTKLLDTRKTLPGLRLLQKYAVRCGGGVNHRVGLYDMFLIKENHVAAAGSITNAVKNARQLHPEKQIEVEVENLTQLQEALPLNVDRIMLDDFSLADIEQAVQLVAGRTPLEVSGNVSLATIRQYAEMGVDFISVGALTKHVHAVDFSLRVQEG